MKQDNIRNSFGYRARQWLKKFPIVVRTREKLLRRRDLLFYGRHVAIVDSFPMFIPYSLGSCKARAELTILSAGQTFPFLVHLLETSGDKKLIKSLIKAEEFCSGQESMESAAQLGRALSKYGSDKSNPNNYHLVYGSILKAPASVSAILEIGLGSNNRDVVSNMGHYGRPGASLRAFRDCLPSARIFGADVDKRILFQEERIETFFVDQTNLSSLDALGRSINTDFDLIIDDGLHSPNANIAVLGFALNRLKSGGWVVVEDIAHAQLPIWQVVTALIPEGYTPHLIAATNSIMFAVQRH